MSMVYSFLSDYLQQYGFFKDKMLTPAEYQHQFGGTGGIDKWYEWGTRHYLFYWMGVCLFLVQFVRIIVYAIVEGGYTFNSKSS